MNFLSKGRGIVLAMVVLSAVGASSPSLAAPNFIAYLSSSTGYMLYRSGSEAVTANWDGQPPIIGFSGYGQIRVDGLCLTGNRANLPLTWERCRTGDTGQRWGIASGQLRNEGGWCADLKGNTNGPGVPILAWQCSGAINQRWKAHYSENVTDILARIPDLQLRNSLALKISAARYGTQVQLTPAEASALIAAGGLNLIAASGQNLIAAGGQNLIAAGGQNLNLNQKLFVMPVGPNALLRMGR